MLKELLGVAAVNFSGMGMILKNFPLGPFCKPLVVAKEWYYKSPLFQTLNYTVREGGKFSFGMC